MNAGWILPVALACCGADYADQNSPDYSVAQAQYGQPVSQPPATASARIVNAQPTSQYGAQQNQQYATQQYGTQQYAAQPSAQYQNAANNQPTLPPTNASSFGQQGSSFAQPSTQTYQQGSSFAQQPSQAQQPRSSVFSAQPTANSNSQGWTGATDPRNTAAATNDPRYGTAAQTDPRYASAPPLIPPENSTAQQYPNQYNASSPQFNNTLRDPQQPSQQYGQPAQSWQQPASQPGQQSQPYLSSLTNNPYAYVPAQPQPDPSANQYLADNSQSADNQFGRSVLVNNPNTASSFGQYSGGQYASNQQPQTGATLDNRYQNYQQPGASQFASNQLGSNPAQTSSGQSAFTNTAGGNLDPRLAQDPRYAQDPRLAAQDPRSLTLEPPLGATLPSSAQQATANNNNELRSPYENVQTPRVDGQGVPQNTFGSAITAPRNATTGFTSGTKTEVPSLFNDVLPASGSRLANSSAFGSGQFGSSLNNSAAGLGGSTNIELPWTPLVASLLCLFASVGANFYFGWNFTEYYFRYRKLLVEGDDDDRSRPREDDRDTRRR